MVDAWTGPTPNAQQFPREPTDAVQQLLDVIDRQRTELNEMRNNLLSTAGLSVTPSGLIVDSSLTVNGDLGTSGDTTLGGNVAITGTLSLPAGIIDNDALANPFVSRSGWETESSFAMPGGEAFRCHVPITVPSGFTKMIMFGTGVTKAVNDEGSWEYLVGWVEYQINGSGPVYSPGSECGVDVQNGRTGVLTMPFTWSTNVIPGDVYEFWINVWTQEPWSADSLNRARLDVTCLFTR